MIDLKGYSEVRQILLGNSQEIKVLTQKGWHLLGVMRCDGKTLLNKILPYMTQGNSYPSSHSYTEEVAEAVLVTVLGLPTEAAHKDWSEQISTLEEALHTVQQLLAAAKAKILPAETEAAKYKEAFATLEARFKEQAAGMASQLVNNHALSSELTKLKAGMSHLVSKVGGASLAELQEQDKIEEEIKKAAEVGVAQ